MKVNCNVVVIVGKSVDCLIINIALNVSALICSDGRNGDTRRDRSRGEHYNTLQALGTGRT